MPNKLVSNTLFIFIIRFFPSLANLLVLILFSRFLPQNIYGNYTRFFIHLNVLYPLACIGIHALIITYSPEFIVKLAKRISVKYYILYFAWVIILSIAFSVLQQTDSIYFFVVSFFFLFAFSVSVILESVLIAFKNYKTLVFTNVIFSLAFFISHWLLLKMQYSIYTLFFYLLLTVLFKLVVYSFSVIKYISVFSQPNQTIEQISMNNVRSLWFHLSIYDVSQSIFTWIDKFIISLVLSASVSAIYYNGTMNIPFLPLLLSAAGSAVLMQLASETKTDNTTNAINYMIQSGRILSCIVFPLFFYLFIYRTDLITLIFTNKYEAAIPIFGISLLVLPLRAYSFTTLLQRYHKGAILNIGSISDLLIGATLMYPLYLCFGLSGVALGFVISTYIQGYYYLHSTAKIINVKIRDLIPYRNWIIKLLLFALIFIIINYIGCKFLSSKLNLIFGSIIMVFTISISLLFEFKNKN